MADITLWTGEVYSFGYCYDDEDDIIVIIPLDENGEEICEEKMLAVSAGMVGLFLEKMQADYKNIMDVRRGIRRGKEKGINPEVVHGRFRGQVLADDVDAFLRELSSGRTPVQDSI